ncbi:MAG: hypothetical protein GX096_13475 [Clostridiales bacterium]|nr:hypothetical protein [Clostridiales bacterium]
MQRMKKWIVLLVCLVPLTLGGCTIMEIEGTQTAQGPNLGLLSMPPYEGERQVQAETADLGSMRVDLWLDATQVMGGIRTREEGLYSRFSKRYREGGFQYQYENEVGMYEYLLMDMLSTVEGSFVRMLRYGNERLPNDHLVSSGLVNANAPEETFRSIRRDLLTYALEPMQTVLSDISQEKMTDGFYSLGTPLLNQMTSFALDDGAKLENPGMVSEMSAALDSQINGVKEGEFTSVGNDLDYPLLYALDNLDLSRLSVITCDPAAIRKQTDIKADGEVVSYISELVERRGIFDSGLTVGLYAFTLDYIGQMESFGTADFAENLLWGRLLYNSNKRITQGTLPMPRILLTLVIGSGEQVDNFASKLDGFIARDENLKGPRGPEKDELTYTANGETITQQPFEFSYEYTSLSRPSVGYYTQYTKGMQLDAGGGQSKVTLADGYPTITFTPSDAGELQSTEITISFPAYDLPDDIKADLTKLNGAGVDVASALLMTKTMVNAADAVIEEDSQVIALREKLYVFEMIQEPFAPAPQDNPFTLKDISFSDDGETLCAAIAVDGTKLKAGYYRIELAADLSGEQLTWLPVDWINGATSLSVTPTNAQIATWEEFAALIAEYERKSTSVPKQFVHAWGPVATRRYHDTVIPDFPPVYLAQGLSELYAQLLSVANVEVSPYVRFDFDVYVTSDQSTP